MTTTNELPDFSHLDLMQKRVITKEGQLTEAEFRDSSAEEQWDYYNWLCRQFGESADLV